jgi:sugar/nucleoside kinase (ribokinase family)
VDSALESNFTENLDCVGQAGGYASRGFASLGKRTAFIGSVGNDHNGRFVRDELARDGIDLRGLFLDPAGTSRSINLMHRDGRRKNFYDGKGHMSLDPDLRICEAILTEARLAHFNIPNWARRLLPHAKSAGMIISCDLQDVVTAGDAYRRQFVEHADMIFFSAVNHASPEGVIGDFLGSNSGRIVIAGMGAKGCAVGTRDGIRFYEPVEMDAPVVDTNGAGDALAVGFLSSYVLDGFSMADSIRRGQIAARYACTQRASSSSLITPEKLEHYFRRLSA